MGNPFLRGATPCANMTSSVCRQDNAPSHPLASVADRGSFEQGTQSHLNNGGPGPPAEARAQESGFFTSLMTSRVICSREMTRSIVTFLGLYDGLCWYRCSNCNVSLAKPDSSRTDRTRSKLGVEVVLPCSRAL